MKKKLPCVMWAGFVDGKIDLGAVHSVMYGDYGYLYPTRKAAQRMYADARKVVVSELKVKAGKP